MNEYRAAVPKGTITGYAQDPNQQVSNAGSPMLDAPLTAKNAIGIGMVSIYAKKVFSTGYKAVVGQFGNSRFEQVVEVGTTIGKYVLIGGASGAAAIVTVPVAILTDIAVGGINSAVETHANNLNNERLVQERGTLIQLGAGDFFG